MRPETIKSTPNFDLSIFCKKSFWQEIQKKIFHLSRQNLKSFSFFCRIQDPIKVDDFLKTFRSTKSLLSCPKSSRIARNSILTFNMEPLHFIKLHIYQNMDNFNLQMKFFSKPRFLRETFQKNFQSFENTRIQFEMLC